MTGPTRILVPTDLSATSDAALAFAKRLAELFDASLHLVHAFEDPFKTAAFAAEAYSSVPLSLGDDLLHEHQARLDERLTREERVRFNGSAEVVTGTPTKSIVEYAASIGADLIVMGTHGRGNIAHVLLGSVAERVVRTAPCPVLTLRQAPTRSVRRILVPTDFSATADAALDSALALAARFGAEVQLLHVLEDPFVAEALAPEAYSTEGPSVRTRMLLDARARLAHRCVSRNTGVKVRYETLFGDGAKTIAEFATLRRCDLIVMGTHGRTGVAHLLMGSIAESLVRTAPCPVFTVRQKRAERAVHAELVYEVAHLPA